MITEIVLVNTPPLYGEDYWIENISWMLIGNLQYDSIHVVRDVVFGGVYDKIRIFDECKENKQYIYFDLDLVIKDDVSHLLRKDFTVLHAWWRPPYHTPLNSSIMSWQGDQSRIFEKFNQDPDYYIVKYDKGIDEFIYKEIEHKTYDKVCDSFRWKSDGDYPITLFNQAKDMMKDSWAREYML